jgi:hypothetical protein
MYVQHCDAGLSWNGSACTGTVSKKTWNNGIGTGTSSGATSLSNGKANTTTLAASVDSDSPYLAANYCHNLNEDGHTDWFLPAVNQLSLMQQQAYTSTLFPESIYWTSTENSTTNADYVVASVSGTVHQDTKTGNSEGTRCMRE